MKIAERKVINATIGQLAKARQKVMNATVSDIIKGEGRVSIAESTALLRAEGFYNKEGRLTYKGKKDLTNVLKKQLGLDPDITLGDFIKKRIAFEKAKLEEAKNAVITKPEHEKQKDIMQGIPAYLYDTAQKLFKKA